MRFDERRRERIALQYRELSNLSPDLYRECVQSASAIVLNQPELFGLEESARLRIGADIEQRLVSVALRAIKLEVSGE